MSYLDKTFCPFWKECKDGKECPDRLTDKIRFDAEVWWGKEIPPVSQHAMPPICFKGINDD